MKNKNNPLEITASDGDLETLLEEGLTNEEAAHRLERYGPNKLPEETPPSTLKIFISQFKSPLVYILLGATVVTLLLGEYTDAAVISFAVFINTILGFIQEERAGKALEALKKLVNPEVRVLREGTVITLPLKDIVPGDIVLLRQGDKVPADGKFLSTNRLFVEEAILTGESVPVSKEENSEGYMGTLVTAGTGKLLVTATGQNTEMGKIAVSVGESEDKTPLGRQLDDFSKRLTILVVILLLIVLTVGLISGKPPLEIFTTSVALAVSAIPEGLLVGLTVILAIGMQRILARKGLVRNLVSAETLGGVTTICVDKTGTLTEGKMQVVSLLGEQKELAYQSILANDLDDPVVIAAWEWAKSLVDSVDDLTRRFPRVDSIPFSSEHQFFASLNEGQDSQRVIFLNGAPEVIMSRSNLNSEEKRTLMQEMERLTSEGKRLIGMARKTVSAEKEKLDEKDTAEGFTWVGLLAFTDPVRPDVKAALEKTSKAGIRLIVITGDYANTAASVMKELGLNLREKNILTGEELKSIDQDDLWELLSRSKEPLLFARTKPNQKLKIVEILKEKGEIVAMMGDGVNDAPAVSRADIGIVVAEASDVAKESADLVLLDSSFSTIVAAIEEGRGIFDNTRKVILYLMADAFEDIFVVLAATILGLPLPITAVQILWINVISDGFPHLALTVDPKSKGIMERKPRSPRENLVTPWISRLLFVASLSGGVFALFLYIWTLRTTGDLILARSVAFATIGFDSLVYVFSVRALAEPFWKVGVFSNKWLLVAVGAGAFFQILPFVFTPLGELFEVIPLGMRWAGVFLVSIAMFIVIEIYKWIFRHRLKVVSL